MSVINGLNGFGTESHNVVYDNTTSGLESTDVKSAIDEIALLNKSDTSECVLLSDNWSGMTAPFTYKLFVDGITNESTVYVSLPNNATSEMVSMVANALLDVNGIGEGYVEIISRGNKLMVDVPIMVHVSNVIPVPRGRDAYYIGYVAPEEIPITATNAGDAINQLCNLIMHSGLSTDAVNVHVDDTSLNIGAKNVQDVLNYILSYGFIAGRDHALVTIPASSWEGDTAPYTARVNVYGVEEKSEISISAPFELSPDEYQVISHADIVTGKTHDDYITLKAFGDKPSIDLSLVIHILQNPNRHLNIELSADSWEGDTAPYTASIEMPGVTKKTNAGILTPFDITVDQYQELSHSEIITSCTSDGKVILKAFGQKPTMNFPVDIYTTNIRCRHVIVNIPADSWEGVASPYMTHVGVIGVDVATDVDIITPFDITVDQYYELTHAGIVTSCTGDGRVVLKAFGEKPKLDLIVDILIYV